MDELLIDNNQYNGPIVTIVRPAPHVPENEVNVELQRTIRLVGRVEAAFTRHERFLELNERTALSFIEARHRLDKIVGLYDQVLSETVKFDLSEELIERINALEDRYFLLFARLESLITELSPMTLLASSTPMETHQKFSLSEKTTKSVMKTPKLNIPTFDGTTSKWLKFRDLFMSMVHENPNIDEITKFLYLEEAITIPDGQSNVLENFAVSSKNYDAAWKAVCTRYDDKRKILAHHMNGIMSVNKMENSSAFELLRLIDTFESNLSALAQFNYQLVDDDDLPNLIFVHLLTTKLHDDTLKEWRKENDCDTPTFKELRDFLRILWRSLDDLRPEASTAIPQSIADKINKGTKSFVANNSSSKSESPCVACSGNHGLWSCSRFLAMNNNERWNIVKSNQLCFMCLRKGHSTQDCTMTDKLRCKSCHGAHGSLLHYEKSSSSSNQSTDSPNPSAGFSDESKSFTPYQNVEARGTTNAAKTLSANSHRKVSLMATVAVLVRDARGDPQVCRALLDSGSDMNFITSKCAERLMLALSDTYATVQGIHGQTVVVRKRIITTIESRYGHYQKELDFSVLPDITGQLPERTLDVDELKIPSSYFLADPKFFESTDVDMLLNSSVFFDALLTQKVALASGPSLIETVYGWIIGGEIVKSNRISNSYLVYTSTHVHSSIGELDATIKKFPEASAVTHEASDVAEMLFGVESLQERTKIHHDIRHVLSKDGMSLIKISANDKALPENLPLQVTDVQDERQREAPKMIGVVYRSTSDQFSFALHLSDDCELTRSKVCSHIAIIYDPLRWISPVVLTTKLFTKRLSILKVGWTETLSDEIAQEWIWFRDALPSIKRIIVNRHFHIDNHVRLEIHGFADSSLVGFGTTSHALSYDAVNNYQIYLICANFCVAPANQKTFTRLELCAATSLAKLIHRTISTFKLPINDVTLWSDSTIVLTWISIISASRQKILSGNNVTVNQKLTHHFISNQIRGVDNPSDITSRSLASEELETCEFWWNKPSSFKKSKLEWPTSIITLNEHDPEVVQKSKKTFVVRRNDMFTFIETVWSSLRTLIRCVAWMRKTIAPTIHHRSQAASLHSSLDELQSTRKFIVKTKQQSFFPHEYELIVNQREFDVEPVDDEAPPEITKKSVLHSLTSIIDEDGIIRVGGQLARSSHNSDDKKHPIVLPDCHSTSILIHDNHSSNSHPGSQALVSIVREIFWPIGLKKIIKTQSGGKVRDMRYVSCCRTRIYHSPPRSVLRTARNGRILKN